MLGAIVGDVVGSKFEFNNYRKKDFTLFDRKCFATDDSIMTLAVADALLRAESPDDLPAYVTERMQSIGRLYPTCGFGGSFYHWVFSDNPKPYRSYGNGAAMRVSPCAHVAKSKEEAILLSRLVTAVTHDHPEGLRGAEATVVATYLALHGATKEEIGATMRKDYYPLDFTLDEIRSSYEFNETCQNTVPQAIEAFLESTDFEDAIRNAISVGGDSDTLAAICGAIAGAYYGVPDDIANETFGYLDERLRDILIRFEKKYPPKRKLGNGIRIFLIRHGESVANTGENDVARLPDHLVPLTKKGLEQARKTGKWLKAFCDEYGVDLTKARIWRSPYLRTRQTSEAFNESLGITDIREDVTLTEQQFGLFDCVPEDKQKALFPREYEEYERQTKNMGKFYARLPMGESPYDVAIRIHQFMGTLWRDYEKHGVDTLFVFTHGTAMRAFLLRWFHYSPEWYQEERNPFNCAIRLIDGKKDCGYVNKDPLGE